MAREVHCLNNTGHHQKKDAGVIKRRVEMNRHIKPTFAENSDATFVKQGQNNVKDLGIEFMHFDTDDNMESRQVMPLGKFISDAPLSNEEYLITRSLVAAQATK